MHGEAGLVNADDPTPPLSAEPGDTASTATESHIRAKWRAQFLDFSAHAYPRVLQFLMFYGATRHDAEDAAQAAFLDAWAKVASGDWESIGSHFSWIRRVALNNYRRPKGQKRFQPLISDCRELPDLPDPGADHARLTDGTVLVLQALASLAEPQRAVMALTLDQATDSEIAKELGITSQKVRDLRKQAKIELRRQLGREEDLR
ncbi:RNA polymerase sigma factor [Streptomyces sp. NPDC056468]|uniref:RNA polymerase sigma factor n=1 Tax=Streptomyces sp. NPDC056468 TaxID=3345830 RepID=UPI0036A264F0